MSSDRRVWESEWDKAFSTSKRKGLLISGPGGRPHTIQELREIARGGDNG